MIAKITSDKILLVFVISVVYLMIASCASRGEETSFPVAPGEAQYFAGEEAAGVTQAAAEYFPAPKQYGNFCHHPKAPGYLKHSPMEP